MRRLKSQPEGVKLNPWENRNPRRPSALSISESTCWELPWCTVVNNGNYMLPSRYIITDNKFMQPVVINKILPPQLEKTYIT